MNLNIAILPGDGIGPEIVEQAMKAVKAVAKKYFRAIADIEKKMALTKNPSSRYLRLLRG